eukprot:919910-Pleurochrysis_carterae.AAC.1
MGQRAVSAGMLMLGQSKDPKVVDALKEVRCLFASGLYSFARAPSAFLPLLVSLAHLLSYP